MNILGRLGKLLLSFFIFLSKPLKVLWKFLYQSVILNIYRYIFRIVQYINNVLGPVKNIYLLPFFNRYVSHIIILIITISIVFLNYNITETRAENFGESSILYGIAKGGDFDDLLIEETVEEEDMASTDSSQNFVIIPQEVIPGSENLTSNLTEEETVIQGGAISPTELASLNASKSNRDKIINYEVKSGDTLSSIAEKFDLKLSSLLWANNLTAYSYLKLGQNLDIPPTDGIIYKIKKGDTINALAKKYQTDSEKIIKYNKLAGASDIEIGMILILPDAKPYQAPVPIQPTKIAPVKNIFAGDQKPTNVGSAKLIWPTTTRRVSQYYSWRHTALDIDGGFGDIIWSSGDGVVTRVQYLTRDYGYHVIVDHGNGVQTLYAHFQKIYVTQGQAVKQGESLGEMGSTGRSTGSHLHYEVRVGGKRLNPFAWVTK